MDVNSSNRSALVERRPLEDALTFLVQCGAPGSGEDFFLALARYLAVHLEMDYVCIDRLEEGLLSAQTVAVYFDGKFEDNVSYTLHDTPCGEVVGKSVCVFARGVRHQFPRDLVLQEMGAESYLGTTLWNSDGRPSGLIALIGRKPLSDSALATSLLQLVAVRAGAELERRQAETALRESEAALQRTNRELRAANESLEARVQERTADLERRTVQLRALAVQLTRAEEKERRRAAELIHDQFQQLLAVGRIELELLSRQCRCAATPEGVRRLDAVLAEALAVARSLTADLSPSVLYRGGLAAAVQWLGRWYQDRHRLAVNVVVDEDVGVVAEEVRITLFRSVRELLFNVVKHARVTAVEVRVGRDGRAVLISVHDNGVGFDVAEVRAREGTSGSFGLFSLRERLDMLGGSLEVVSAPGCGTRVILRAPVLDAATAGAPAEERAAAAAGVRLRDRPPIRVVLVDDHAVVRDGLMKALADEADLDVVGQAADGEEAVAVTRATQPDVVLMDIGLPILDGIEATRRIHSEWPRVRVIGLSVFDDESHQKAMAAAGAVDCLDKSAPLARVVGAIRRSRQMT